jgi:hypothetical protein
MTSSPNNTNHTSDRKDEYKAVNAIDSAYDVIAGAFNKIFKEGKILYGKGNANPTKSVAQYVTLQNMLINRLREYHEKGKGASDSYVKYYDDLKDRFERGLIGEDEFRRLSSNIIQSLERFSEAVATKFSEVNTNVNKISESIKSDSQEIIELRDSMLKKRILYLALMISPFLSIPVLDVLSNSIGGLFDPTATMGETVSEKIVGLRRLGFFGEILDMMEFDKAIKYLIDDFPLISNFFGLIDEVGDTQLAHALGSITKSILGSPLPYFMASATGAAKFTEAELKLIETRNAKFKSAQETINKQFKKVDKDYDELHNKMAKETMESEFHSFEEAFKIKKIIDLLFKIKKYDSLDQAFVKEIPGIDKASTKEEMKKILLDFDSAQIDKALKKLTVAEKSINEKIYTELKDPKHSQKMIQGENGMITVDEFLKTYDNYEKFSENYLKKFNINFHEQFTNVLDSPQMQRISLETKVAFENRYNEDAHKEFLDQLTNQLKKDFGLFVENCHAHKFRENGWRFDKNESDVDYYDTVKKFYGEVFAKDLLNNSQRQLLEAGVMPPNFQSGDQPLQLEEKVEKSQKAQKALWDDLTKIVGDEKWVDKVKKGSAGQKSPAMDMESLLKGMGSSPGGRGMGG